MVIQQIQSFVVVVSIIPKTRHWVTSCTSSNELTTQHISQILIYKSKWQFGLSRLHTFHQTLSSSSWCVTPTNKSVDCTSPSSAAADPSLVFYSHLYYRLCHTFSF